ncbi:Mu-like prophage protein gp29 [Loktanella sp. DSM 29012]|nr:Mu-like prophage protein gp29 [Loktanella sp. DSM 29012]
MVKIRDMLRDAWGRLVKTGELTEEQAEGGMTGVRQSWVESVASGLTPQALAGILQDCDRGELDAFMTLAEEMEERDPHYASVLGQRKRAVSGIKATVKPYSEDAADVAIAIWVEDNITGHDQFADLVEDLMDAVGKGFAVVEIDWSTDATGWTPRAFVWRTQRFFQFDRETGRKIRLRDDADPLDGVELRPFRFIVHTAKLKSGQAFRGGLARVVAFSWMCKAYTVKDWMAFVETYGLPLRLGKYDQAATKQDVATLFRAVANIGTDAAAVIPKHMDIEFVQNTSGNGSQPIFENLARYVDEQISKAVLGQTMTTDNGSSQAQANVHNEVRHDVATADARGITGSINRDLVIPAVLLNFGPVKGFPKVLITVEEPEDIKAKVDGVVALASAGVTFKATEARGIVRMSDPDDDDEVFGGAPAAPEPTRKARVWFSRFGSEADMIDDIQRDMLSDWEPVMDELMEPFMAAIAEADSYETARAALDKIDGLPSSRLIDQLVRASFTARAAGDVADG